MLTEDGRCMYCTRLTVDWAALSVDCFGGAPQRLMFVPNADIGAGV